MNHIINHPFQYEIEKLIRTFFPFEKIETTSFRNGEGRYILTRVDFEEKSALLYVELSLSGKVQSADDSVKRETDDDYVWKTEIEKRLAQLLFGLLFEETGYYPPWGILTGIRPSKLMVSFCEKYGQQRAREIFEQEFLVTKDKTTLALTVAENEKRIIRKSKPNSFSLYVSIPFCPSRCSYCSFVSSSNEQAKKLIPEYIQKLVDELKETASIVEKLNLELKSIYVGGGTPTALSADELKVVIDAVNELFSPSGDVEFTVEAGRPDSITEKKLVVIKDSGAQRISVNPQSFNDEVLRQIGREHTSEQTENALILAKSFDFDCINTDVIVGLPSDNLQSFEATMKKLLTFEPENITVHTLALKRSSFLQNEGHEFEKANEAVEMLNSATALLKENGYKPYYMYRQSKCLGNLENVGWTLEGKECEYNIQMMEETHTVLAVGAGAVSKLKRGDKIERIFNFKYPFEYISQFDEIISRKAHIFEFFSH